MPLDEKDITQDNISDLLKLSIGVFGFQGIAGGESSSGRESRSERKIRKRKNVIENASKCKLFYYKKEKNLYYFYFSMRYGQPEVFVFHESHIISFLGRFSDDELYREIENTNWSWDRDTLSIFLEKNKFLTDGQKLYIELDKLN